MLSSSPPTAPPPSSSIAGVPSAQFAQLFAQLTQAVNALDTDGKANAALIATTIGDALASLGGAYETGSWAPTLAFGTPPMSTGITYALQSGLYTRTYRVVVAIFFFQLTSKGSAAGVATIGTLPFSSSPLNASQGAGGVATAYENVAGLTGIPTMFIGTASATIQPLQATSSTITPITDANFTNTTVLAGSVTYFI